MKDLGRDRATGLDYLPGKFLNYGCSEIVGIFTVINLSSCHSTAPNDLKTARLVP